jgi:hypothetical protein
MGSPIYRQQKNGPEPVFIFLKFTPRLAFDWFDCVFALRFFQTGRAVKQKVIKLGQ